MMVAIGMLVGVAIAAARAKKLKEDPATVVDLTIWVVIAGILGARFMFIFLENWQTVASQSIWATLKSFVMIRQGGLSFLGALAFAVPTGLIYLRWKKMKVWKMADISAPSVAIGIAFARIGCFLNGCCFGRICDTNAFYAVEFPVDSLPYNHYGHMVPLYPTQLINSLNAFIIFVVLTLIFGYRKRDGQIFWLFVLLYSTLRFLSDFLRGDSSDTFFGGLFLGVLTLAQIFCIVGFVTAVIMLIRLSTRANEASSPAS